MHPYIKKVNDSENPLIEQNILKSIWKYAEIVDLTET